METPPSCVRSRVWGGFDRLALAWMRDHSRGNAVAIRIRLCAACRLGKVSSWEARTKVPLTKQGSQEQGCGEPTGVTVRHFEGEMPANLGESPRPHVGTGGFRDEGRRNLLTPAYGSATGTSTVTNSG